jgi:glycosyltransferase involved in cell wall biosynthesis
MNAEKRPRVSHVLRKYVSAEWGGTESHVSAVTDLQSRRGWDVDVFAPRCKRPERGPLATTVNLKRYHAFLPFVGESRKRAEAIRHAGNIASLDLPIRVASSNPNIVHLHTSRRIGGAAVLGASLRRRPYIISLHGPMASDTTWMEEETSQRYRGLIDMGQPLGLLFKSRRVLENAARVICFNDDEYEGLCRFLPKHKVVRMSHGVDLERFSQGNADPFLRGHPGLLGKTVVLCIGRLCRQKNQLLAVEAFAKADLDDACLVFAGSETDAGYENEILDRAETFGCRERILLLGNVEPETIPNALAAATITIVPSSQEAFGLTAIESWAANRPALCARTAGLIPLASKLTDQRFFVDGADSDEWARRLRKLAADPEALSSAGAEGQSLVRRELSWTSRVDELLALYQEVIEEHSA